MKSKIRGLFLIVTSAVVVTMFAGKLIIDGANIGVVIAVIVWTFLLATTMALALIDEAIK